MDRFHPTSRSSSAWSEGPTNHSSWDGTPRSHNGAPPSSRGVGDDTYTSLDSYRSAMSTARVYTALAALTAEREALKAKLSIIDSQLENTKRKKAKEPEKR